MPISYLMVHTMRVSPHTTRLASPLQYAEKLVAERLTSLTKICVWRGLVYFELFPLENCNVVPTTLDIDKLKVIKKGKAKLVFASMSLVKLL